MRLKREACRLWLFVRPSIVNDSISRNDDAAAARENGKKRGLRNSQAPGLSTKRACCKMSLLISRKSAIYRAFLHTADLAHSVFTGWNRTQYVF